MKKFSVKRLQLSLILIVIVMLVFLSTNDAIRADDEFILSRVKSRFERFPFDTNSFISWNTFMGSSNDDGAYAVAVDGIGNIYVAGSSDAIWGSAISPYAGDYDVFVAKLNANGVLQWNTFLGSDSSDNCGGIGVDESGNVYVAGTSTKSWGTPLNPYTGNEEAFLVKLDTNGSLEWNTFLGHETGNDLGTGIAVDTSGYVYVTGWSCGEWASPVNGFSGGQDVFVAKLNSSGTLQWNTFMGSAEGDLATAIDVDTAGNVYVTGWGNATWGIPISDFMGNTDIVVAKLDNNGALQWNTFMGGADWEEGWGIAVDSNGDIFVSGHGTDDYSGGVWDALIAKFDNSGALDWSNTMGCSGDDFGWNVAVNNDGYVYVAGMSVGTWGTPVNPFVGMADVYIAKLSSEGAWQWHTFMGSADFDGCSGIVLDTGGNIFVAGRSDDTWGMPINPHTGYGNFDAFVAKLEQEPEINVKFRGIRIPDGAGANLGTRPSSLLMGREFIITIENQGAALLNLTGSPLVSLSGPQASQFTISQQPSSQVASFDATTFKLRTVRDSLPGFLPIGWTYPVSITVNIPNDDADENPYDFTINFKLEKDT